MDEERAADVVLVACSVCMKEIPVSEANSVEARGYVAYFCGLDCYQQWQQQQRDEEE